MYSKQNWFLSKWMRMYYPLLGKRADTFKSILEYLCFCRKPPYKIIETGTLRTPNNFAGDGCSTLFWDELVMHFGGYVESIDIQKEATDVCKTFTYKTNVVTADSLERLAFLSSSFKDIDLLYLDSFDVDFNNSQPSMEHHLKEFEFSLPMLGEGSLIVIDDNIGQNGKGTLVKRKMEELGKNMFVDAYQIGWVF